MDELNQVFLQLDEEIESARLACEEAETRLKVANAVFDRLMRLKPRIKNRIEKVSQASKQVADD